MSALIDILLRGLPSLSGGEKAILARELAKLENTALDVGRTVQSGGRVKRITNSNLTIEDGLTIVNPETGYVTVHLQPDGDSFFGDNVELPASTSFIIFSQAQTYNDEVMGAGDVLFGDNSTSKANILWDASAGKFLLRGGVTTQLELGTDGILTAGAGALSLSTNGIRIVPGATQDGLRSYSFHDGATLLGGMYAFYANPDQTVYISAESATRKSHVTLYAFGDDESNVKLEAASTGEVIVSLYLRAFADYGYAHLNMGGLKIGGITQNPTTGQLYIEDEVLMQEITEPAAPAANQGKLYLKDVGGKTTLCARFATGAVQVIASEP